jgi:hypothetical protein
MTRHPVDIGGIVHRSVPIFGLVQARIIIGKKYVAVLRMEMAYRRNGENHRGKIRFA